MSVRERFSMARRERLANKEIRSQIADSGLNDISFEIRFLKYGGMRVDLFNDEKRDENEEMSEKDVLTIRTLASIFTRTAREFGLVYEPGATFDWNFERAS